MSALRHAETFQELSLLYLFCLFFNVNLLSLIRHSYPLIFNANIRVFSKSVSNTQLSFYLTIYPRDTETKTKTKTETDRQRDRQTDRQTEEQRLRRKEREWNSPIK